MNTLVTIIIPAFNAELTLADAIRSAKQMDNIEIIVVDDGSNDKTLTVAREFEPFVTCLTGPNKGVSAARNRGIDAARGEWVIFLDADDVLLPNTISMRLATAVKTGADVVICDWEREEVSNDGKPLINVERFAWGAFPEDVELRYAIHWAAIHACMYRREMLSNFGAFKEGMPLVEDARLLFDMAHMGAQFAHSDHVGCRYRFVTNSASRSGKNKLPYYIYQNICYNQTVWERSGQLTPLRREALAERYLASALSFFSQADPLYWEAMRKARQLGGKKGIHSRLTYPLARLIGIPESQRISRQTKRIINRLHILLGKESSYL